MTLFSKPRTLLLCIDTQNDFCLPTGSLSVPGAMDDCRRAGTWIKDHIQDVDHVSLTMDSHHTHAIFFGHWHIGPDGKHPDPFTLITLKDYLDGRWTTSDPRHRDDTIKVLRGLEQRGRFSLVIWPTHCRIGTPGWSIQDDILEAVTAWEIRRGKIAQKITKGTDPRTEHYSPFGAEVPLDDNPDTQLNINLITSFDRFDRIIVIGQARSHCVANGVRDLLDNLRGDLKKLVLFEDCMSNVPGFENLGQAFFDDARTKGAIITNTRDFDFAA